MAITMVNSDENITTRTSIQERHALITWNLLSYTLVTKNWMKNKKFIIYDSIFLF